MTSSHAVLIVDTDSKGLESLVYGFQGAEWRMTACPSPETASLLIRAAAAQLVVIASRTEHERTHSLIRQLRAKDVWRALPVLVLGPEEMRPALAEHGNVDLLSLPAFVRDVLTASELLVGAGQASAQPPGDEPCLRGPITSARTLSIVRTMSGLVRSGHLRLERNGRAGEILFHQGELTSASVGPLEAMAAVQHLMVWNDGHLELRLRQVPRRGQLHLTAPEFVQELDRFQRDYTHALREIGPASVACAASQERLKQAGDAIPAEVTPVVRLCDGKRPLSDVIDESPFRVLDTVRILARLAELGVLTRADGRKVTPAVTPHGADEEFLATARIVGSPRAWPMPAPIGGFPTSPPAPATPGSGPPVETAPASASPPLGERPRRQTREIGVSTPPVGQPVAPREPTPAVPPATPTSAGAAAPPPTAPVAAVPFAPAGSDPMVATPIAQVATKRLTPVTTAPLVSPNVGITPAPVAATRPAGPVATITQVSGGSAPSSPARPESPAAQVAGTLASQPVAPAGAVPLSATRPGGLAGGTAAARPGETPTPRPLAPAAPTTMTAAAPAKAAVAPSGAVVRPLASPPTGPNAIAGATQVGGVIESRKTQRRAQHPSRAVREHPRVVIEPLAAGSVTNLPTAPPADAKPIQAANTPPAAVAPPVAPGSARITGVLETVPSRRTQSQATPPPPARIQLDASLAEAGKVSPAVPSAASPAPGTRVTGEMRTVPSGRTARPAHKVQAAPSSFHIDPSLSDKPAPAPTTPAPRRTDSRPVEGLKRRASGGFSSIETDFFEREADLYKEEKPESFADLDTGKGKPKPKGKPTRTSRR